MSGSLQPPPPQEALSFPDAVDGETAVEALRRSEAYFRALVENARDVIHVINEDGTTRYITPSVRHLLGWDPAEMVGKSALGLIHPDDVEAATRQVTESREMPGGGRALTLRARHHDGSWRVFEAVGRNLLDDPRVRGIIVNSRDVTERRRSEEQSLRMAAFARENPNPIFELAPDGAVVWVNAAGQRLVAELGVDGPGWVLPPEHAELLRQAADGVGIRDREARVGARVFAWSYHPQPSLGTVHLFGEEVTDRKRVEDRLLHDALHDALTGLPNRLLFMQRLGESLFRFNQGGGQFAVLFLDLDRFKVVNDSLGHHVGDELLVAVSRRLQESVRASDTVARFGGDEFAILLSELEATSDATTIAARVAAAVAAPVNLSGYEIFTSASIGIALASNGYERPEYLLRNADMAMYRAKGSAAGLAWEVFDRGMHAQALARLQMETDLRRALQRGEFRLHYQPIISLATGRIAGVEALARWEHPERGLVEPADFIPMAEETGAIVPLGEWVVREACRQLAEWRTELGVGLAVNVNLSARQLAQPGLVEVVRSALDEAGLEPADLKLEITESALLETTAAESVLAELRALGVEMQLDDFGTGYSSLSALHRLPMQALKVDRAFVSRMEGGNAPTQLVRTIALMARGLELTVIAEGVETAAQLAEVRAIGCDYAQGYLLSRPLPTCQLRDLLVADPSW